MEFYQVKYVIGDEEGSWEQTSELYRKKENAEAFMDSIGFTKHTRADGSIRWEEHYGPNKEYSESAWVDIYLLKVMD